MPEYDALFDFFYLEKESEVIKSEINSLCAIISFQEKYPLGNTLEIKKFIRKLSLKAEELQAEANTRKERISSADDVEIRVILYMRYLQRMAFDEIALDLDCDRTTITRKLHRYVKNKCKTQGGIKNEKKIPLVKAKG